MLEQLQQDITIPKLTGALISYVIIHGILHLFKRLRMRIDKKFKEFHKELRRQHRHQSHHMPFVLCDQDECASYNAMTVNRLVGLRQAVE